MKLTLDIEKAKSELQTRFEEEKKKKNLLEDEAY